MALYGTAGKVLSCFLCPFFEFNLFFFSLSVRALDYSVSKTSAFLDQPDPRLPFPPRNCAVGFGLLFPLISMQMGFTLMKCKIFLVTYVY